MKFLMLTLTICWYSVQGQELQDHSYNKLSDLFNAYSENDERAMVFVNLYINKARKNNDDKHLIIGYEEAIYYNKDVNRKLAYADSAVIHSLKTKDADAISRAYLGKGIVYYYNLRKYKLALREYLLAFKYLEHSTDYYQINKVTYHLGMVKSYLGYYEDAASHFVKTANYFETHSRDASDPEIILNNESGYFNSIYRLSNCYRYLKLYDKEDSLINMGLRKLENNKDLSLEYGYFLKGKGIQLLRKGKPTEAIRLLKLSQKILIDNQDNAALVTLFFYLGKSYWMKKERNTSLKYLNKVDSIVFKYQFVTPEIRTAYKYLIKDAKENKDRSKQLYYTDHLLRSDSIMNVDFVSLSAKIHTEYDTDTLMDERNELVREHHYGRIVFYSAIGLTIFLTVFLPWRYRRKEKILTQRYYDLLNKFDHMNQVVDTSQTDTEKIETVVGKNLYSDEIINTIKVNLKLFEGMNKFLKPGLTLSDLASEIGTNRTHLSYVLNEHLHQSFTLYIKTLRINYITNHLLNDKKYLNYTIDSLAKESGMSNRQIFSAHFFEINGIRPADFIRKTKEELKKS